MKKLVLFLIVVLVLGSGTSIAEADRNYSIDVFHAEAQLNPDGSMDVQETITYDFKGEFNGVYRKLITSGSSGIDNIEIMIGYDGQIPIIENHTGNNNTYEILKESDGLRIKIYSKSKDEIKKFIIKYRVLNVAVKYNDTAELYWKFMGEDTEVYISDFKINLSLPEGASSRDIRAFAHGPLSGNIEIKDGRNVVLSVGELLPHNFVEARILFPVSLIEASHNVIYKSALNEIVSEEKRWVDEANSKRRRARALIFFTFLYAAIELLLIAYIYYKYDKEYKTAFEGTYYRELPADYSPAVMSVLWNFGRINPRDITATLMDLVRRKYISLSMEATKKKGIFSKSDDINYAFILNESTDASELSKHEAFFIDWIFHNIGSSNRVSLDDIENYAKSETGAQNFKSDYDAWFEHIKQEAEAFNFFDKTSVQGMVLGIIASLLGFVLAIYTIIAHKNILGFAALLLTSLTLMIYSITVKRRSKYGVLQFQMWKAFKRFLTHFSMLDKAELPSVILWEHYLVYAISLGVAKEVIKQLKVIFKEEDFNNKGLTYMYYGYYGRGFNHFDALNTVTSTVTRATESTYKQAVSQISSSGGGGGGFSGGGGGGGGGGGTGAF